MAAIWRGWCLLLIYCLRSSFEMDFLSSILNAMDKPPAISEKQLELRRKQKEEIEKRKLAEAAAMKHFRENIQKKMEKFVKDEKAKKYEFEPMDKIQRSIVHDVAEVAGVAVFSIGEEDIDRRVLMFKKEFMPCEEEMQALKRGEKYDPERARLEREERAKEEAEARTHKKPEKFKPNHNYKDKYSHLIGTTAAKAAAKRTETNKQYGFVPAENKKDVRSIEQTLADIQSKKKLKMSHPNDV